jgi:hypothetical protein
LKTLFFLLLLANVGYFAWNYLGDGGASGDAQRVSEQVNEEAIKLLSAEQVAALVTAKPKSEPTKPPIPKPTPPKPAVTTAACLEFGGFNQAEAGRVGKALAPLALGARLSQRRERETASYWVYIPPQRSRQAANQKAAELRKLGIDDFFVVPEDSKFRYAISLGIFKTEEAARARLDDLRPKGVRSARVSPRETSVQKVYFVVRDVPDALASKLDDLRRDFPGSELKSCAAAENRGRITNLPKAN